MGMGFVMTQDEIMEMAQECKLIGMRPFIDGIYTEALIEFAKLVAAKEREACAQVAYSWNIEITDKVAEEIRARVEQA
jgi:hypothetical protein